MHKLTRVLALAATAQATNTTAVRRYLEAVYPASSFASVDDAAAVAFFEGLDYFYDCDANRIAAYHPPVRCRNNAPVLPYVAPGAYYSARDATTSERNVGTGGLRGSFTRWRALVRHVHERRYRPLYSTHGGRLGATPSWTHVAALVRYLLYPLFLVDYDVSGSWATLEDSALNPVRACLAPFRDGREAPSRGQVLTHWKRTRKWALVDPLGSNDPVPCRLLARGVGRYAACKGSAAEAVAPLTIRHRLPFAHYSAEYAARLACKNECSAACAAAGECRAPERQANKMRLADEGPTSK